MRHLFFAAFLSLIATSSFANLFAFPTGLSKSPQACVTDIQFLEGYGFEMVMSCDGEKAIKFEIENLLSVPQAVSGLHNLLQNLNITEVRCDNTPVKDYNKISYYSAHCTFSPRGKELLPAGGPGMTSSDAMLSALLNPMMIIAPMVLAN